MHVVRPVAPSPEHLQHASEKEALVLLGAPARPDAVAVILRSGVVASTMIFPEVGSYKRIERWEPPQGVGPDETAIVHRYLRELTSYLAPANRGEVLARILALLSHYRLEAHSPQVEAWIADDWAEDLEGYPMWAINHAARVWRRTMRFKPQTGEIVTLCDTAVASFRRDHERLRLLVNRHATGHNRFVASTQNLASGMLKRMP